MAHVWRTEQIEIHGFTGGVRTRMSGILEQPPKVYSPSLHSTKMLHKVCTIRSLAGKNDLSIFLQYGD